MRGIVVGLVMVGLAFVAGCSSGQTQSAVAAASDESIDLWALKRERAFLNSIHEVSYKLGFEMPEWNQFENHKWEKMLDSCGKKLIEKQSEMKTKYKVDFVEVSDFSKNRDRKRAEVEKEVSSLDSLLGILQSRARQVKSDISLGKSKDQAFQSLSADFDEAYQSALGDIRSCQHLIMQVSP